MINPENNDRWLKLGEPVRHNLIAFQGSTCDKGCRCGTWSNSKVQSFTTTGSDTYSTWNSTSILNAAWLFISADETEQQWKGCATQTNVKTVNFVTIPVTRLWPKVWERPNTNWCKTWSLMVNKTCLTWWHCVMTINIRLQQTCKSWGLARLEQTWHWYLSPTAHA